MKPSIENLQGFTSRLRDRFNRVAEEGGAQWRWIQNSIEDGRHFGGQELLNRSRGGIPEYRRNEEEISRDSQQ